MKTHVNERSSRCAGLTLIELLATLAIGSITLSIAIPSFNTLMGKNAMTSAINTMVTHIHLARSNAITRGTRMILCPSLDMKTCHNSKIWNQGYILVEDMNNNSKADPNEQILQVFQNNMERVLVSSTNSRRKIVFNAQGMSPGYNLTLSFCDKQQAADPKTVIVSNTGRPRLSDKKPDSTPINCP